MKAHELVAQQIAEEGYQDPDGEPILLETLVKKEPHRAANIIRWYKAQLAERTRELSLARAHITRLELGIEPDESLARQLAERTRERDYALERCASWSDTYHREKADWCDERHDLTKERDDASAESARLREAIQGVLNGSEDCNDFGPPCHMCSWCDARQAPAKEGA